MACGSPLADDEASYGMQPTRYNPLYIVPTRYNIPTSHQLLAHHSFSVIFVYRMCVWEWNGSHPSMCGVSHLTHQLFASTLYAFLDF